MSRDTVKVTITHYISETTQKYILFLLITQHYTPIIQKTLEKISLVRPRRTIMHTHYQAHFEFQIILHFVSKIIQNKYIIFRYNITLHSYNSQNTRISLVRVATGRQVLGLKGREKQRTHLSSLSKATTD